MTQLDADPAPGAAQDFGTLAAEAAAFIDGLHAGDLSELAVLVQPQVFGRMAALFQTGKGVGGNDAKGAATDGSFSALDWLRRAGSSIRANARMAPHAANAGVTVVYRRGRPDGMAGAPAICPVWSSGVAIVDPYTDSGAAMTHTSLHVLIGDVLTRYADCYRQWAIKTA